MKKVKFGLLAVAILAGTFGAFATTGKAANQECTQQFVDTNCEPGTEQCCASAAEDLTDPNGQLIPQGQPVQGIRSN